MSQPDLLQGTLSMLILKVLNSRGAMHGYGVANQIQMVSQEALRVDEGSLYPALHRMEDRGWIRSYWGKSENNRRARYYEITRQGLRQLNSESRNWTDLSLAVARIMHLE
jgi:PadR family transcriptional regulator PadR